MHGAIARRGELCDFSTSSPRPFPMHNLKLQSISLAVMCALPVAAGAQQGLQLKSQPTLMLIPPQLKEDVPVFLESDTLRGHAEQETDAEGNVRLRKRGQAIFADWMRYDKPAEDVIAEGNVRIEQGSDVMEGSRLKYNLETDRGFMENPSYTLHKEPGSDRAEAVIRAHLCARHGRAPALRRAGAISRGARRVHHLRSGQRRLVRARQ